MLNKIIKVTEKGIVKKIQKNKILSYSLWEQLDLIIENNALNSQQKQKLLTELRSLVLVNDTSKDSLVVNESLLNSVTLVVKNNYPELPSILTDKIIKSGRRDIIESTLPINDFLNVLLFILIVSLNTKESVSKNVLITHLTIYFWTLSEFKINTESFDYSKLSDILDDIISYDLHLSQIKIKEMSKDMKKTWKCVLFIIKTLLDEGFLIENKSLDFRPSNLQNKYINDLGGPKHNKKGYSMNIISLASNVRGDYNDFNYFLFSKWPLLEPHVYDNENPNIDNETHVMLKKGISKLVSKSLLNKTLECIGRLKLKYNYPLFLEGIEKIKDERGFLQFRSSSLIKNEQLIVRSKQKYLESKKKMNIVETLHRLRTIIHYFDVSKHSVARWIHFMCMKKKIKHKESVFSNVIIRFKNITDKGIFVFDQFDIVFNHLLIYISENYTTYCNSINVKDDIFGNWYQFLDGYSSNHGNNILQLAIDVLKYLGIYKITNFEHILTLYSQKKVNLITLYNERSITKVDFSSDELAILNETNENYKRYIDSSVDYQANLDVTFKVRLMKLYKNKHYYLRPYVVGNGRLSYKGFAPHPHSGQLFRFSETKKEVINDTGLKHLKRSISYLFKNDFGSFIEHEKWVDDNYDKIIKHKYQSVDFLVVIDAYEKFCRNGESTGMMIRIDQVASVLFFKGLISDCPYYKKITNLKVGDIVYKPYSEIAKDFLKPCLDEIYEIWQEKIEENDVTLLNLETFNILKDIILPNIMDKKLNKSIIMPHAYGMTYIGLTQNLINYVKTKDSAINIDKISNGNWFNQLSLKLWHKLQKVSPKTTNLRNILKKTESKLLNLWSDYLNNSENEKNNVFFTNVIEHEDSFLYWDYKTKKKESWGVYVKEKKETQKFKFVSMTNNSCIKSNINSLPPLLIHSIDSAVIKKLILKSDQEFNFIPASIHDAASTHPNNIDSLLKCWKESIYEVLGSGELTNKEFLERIWLSPTCSNLKDQGLDENDIKNIIEFWDKQWDNYCDLESRIKAEEVFECTHNLIYE